MERACFLSSQTSWRWLPFRGLVFIIYPAYLNDVSCGLLVAHVDGQTLVVDHLLVLAQYQRRGLGSLMWDHVLEYCRENSLSAELLVPGTAVAFFEGRGCIAEDAPVDAWFGSARRVSWTLDRSDNTE